MSTEVASQSKCQSPDISTIASLRTAKKHLEASYTSGVASAGITTAVSPSRREPAVVHQISGRARPAVLGGERRGADRQGVRGPARVTDAALGGGDLGQQVRLPLRQQDGVHNGVDLRSPHRS